MATAVQAWSDKTVTQDKDGNTTACTIPYIVSGATDEDEAVAVARSTAPATYGNLILGSASISETLNSTTYRVDVSYKEPDKKDETDPEPTFTFDTTGGTAHLTQSISTRNKYPADAPDYGGAINYDGQDVNGVDVVRPACNFSETHYLKQSVFTESFRAALIRKTGMYNNDSFRGFDEGEVLFLGISARRTGTKSTDLWEVTYNFTVAQNQTDIAVGDLTAENKRGWDYLWCRYEDEIDPDSKRVLKKPTAAYVEKVYYGTNFASLIPAGSI